MENRLRVRGLGERVSMAIKGSKRETCGYKIVLCLIVVVVT